MERAVADEPTSATADDDWESRNDEDRRPTESQNRTSLGKYFRRYSHGRRRNPAAASDSNASSNSGNSSGVDVPSGKSGPRPVRKGPVSSPSAATVETDTTSLSGCRHGHRSGSGSETEEGVHRVRPSRKMESRLASSSSSAPAPPTGDSDSPLATPRRKDGSSAIASVAHAPSSPDRRSVGGASPRIHRSVSPPRQSTGRSANEQSPRRRRHTKKQPRGFLALHIGQHRDSDNERSRHQSKNSVGNSSASSMDEEDDSTKSDTSIQQIQQRRGSFLARMKTLVTRRRSQLQASSSAEELVPGDSSRTDSLHKTPLSRSRSDSIAAARNRQRATMDNGSVAAHQRKPRHRQQEHGQSQDLHESPDKRSQALSVTEHLQPRSDSASTLAKSEHHPVSTSSPSFSRKHSGAGMGPFTRRTSLDLFVSTPTTSNHATRKSGTNGSSHRRHGQESTHGASSSSLGSNVGLLSQEDYQQQQDQYQAQADDASVIGDLDTAIDIWYKSYYLADEQKDTLSNKTEILCTIVNCHLQCRNAITKVVRHGDGGSGGDNNNNNNAGPPRTVDLTPEEQAERREHHTNQAKRIVQRIKPAVVRSQWLSPFSMELFDFLFSHCQAYELALMVATELQGEREQLKKSSSSHAALLHADEPAIAYDTMAYLHTELAKQKKLRRRHGETLQHYQKALEYLLQQPKSERDDMLHSQIIHALVEEYIQQGQYKLAHQMLMDQIHATTSKHAKASIYRRIASDIHIPMDRYDMALECLQTALNLVSRSSSVDSFEDVVLQDPGDGDSDDPNQTSNTSLQTATRNREMIKLQLYQTKADVLFRLGRIEQALREYEKSYNYAVKVMTQRPNPAELAKMLYKLGRISIKLRRYHDAVQYFERELQITQRALGTPTHFSVSRIYHELATVHDEYRNDHRKALECYQQAYAIEQELYVQCQKETEACPQCTSIRHCGTHQQYLRDCVQQLNETKNSQGRIHYKLGNFEMALEATMHHASATADSGEDNGNNEESLQPLVVGQ